MSATAASRSYLRRCQNGIRTESRIQNQLFSISHLQTKPGSPLALSGTKKSTPPLFLLLILFFLHLRSNFFLVGFEFGRSPVEMSCCVETMLPYRTVTSSALRNSMLSVSRRTYGWTPEGKFTVSLYELIDWL
jgi:hypothetical protein